MTLHEKLVLQTAEKLIKQKAIQQTRTFGFEIDNLDITKVSEAVQTEFKVLKNRAKRNNPEIWRCNVYNLPDNAYYNNREFFELCYYIDCFNQLIAIYPDKKQELEKRNDIEDLRYKLEWWNKAHDCPLKFSELIGKKTFRGIDDN